MVEQRPDFQPNGRARVSCKFYAVVCEHLSVSSQMCRFSAGVCGNAHCGVRGMSTAANTQEWARFEAMLDAMRTGDTTTVRAIVDKTGIGAESAELVLEALVRADLFEQHGDQFLRVSVFRSAELH